MSKPGCVYQKTTDGTKSKYVDLLEEDKPLSRTKICLCEFCKS